MRRALVPEIRPLDQYDSARARRAASLAWALATAHGGAGMARGGSGGIGIGAGSIARRLPPALGGRRPGGLGRLGRRAPPGGTPLGPHPALTIVHCRPRSCACRTRGGPTGAGVCTACACPALCVPPAGCALLRLRGGRHA